MTEMILISLFLKNKIKDESKNLCLFKFGVLGYRNLQKWLRIVFLSDLQIILNRLGRGEMTEMKSIIWMTIAFGCIRVIFSSIGQV